MLIVLYVLDQIPGIAVRLTQLSTPGKVQSIVDFPSEWGTNPQLPQLKAIRKLLCNLAIPR